MITTPPNAAILRAITQHPNAEVLRAVADGKPIQYRLVPSMRDEWQDWYAGSWACPTDPRGNFLWRIKPTTIDINGHEVPEPLRTRPNNGESYWLASPTYALLATEWVWVSGHPDEMHFLHGLCHATEEAALAHAEAIISFTKLEG
jgi:hypothetical protein